MAELSNTELLIFLLSPVVIVASVVILFKLGMFGPEPGPEDQGSW